MPLRCRSSLLLLCCLAACLWRCTDQLSSPTSHYTETTHKSYSTVSVSVFEYSCLDPCAAAARPSLLYVHCSWWRSWCRDSFVKSSHICVIWFVHTWFFNSLAIFKAQICWLLVSHWPLVWIFCDGIYHQLFYLHIYSDVKRTSDERNGTNVSVYCTASKINPSTIADNERWFSADYPAIPFVKFFREKYSLTVLINA